MRCPPLPPLRCRRTPNDPPASRRTNSSLDIIFISATRLLVLLPPFTSQKDNDSLSDLRYGHTKIPNLEPGEGESRSCSVTKFSQLFICFVVNKSRNYSCGMYISYSVVQRDFDSCETVIVAVRVRVSSKQKRVREKQGERKKSTEKRQTRERSALRPKRRSSMRVHKT
jgi:hypothetical protein